MNGNKQINEEQLLETVESLEDPDYRRQTRVVINYVVDLPRSKMEKKKANVLLPATQGLEAKVRCDTHFLNGVNSGFGYLEMEGRGLKEVASAATEYLNGMEVENYQVVELSEKFRDEENQFSAFKRFLDEETDQTFNLSNSRFSDENDED